MPLCLLEPVGDHQGWQDSIICEGGLDRLQPEEPVRPLDAHESVTLRTVAVGKVPPLLDTLR